MTGRDDKGRFVKGASGNPKGRAKRETEQSYLEIMQSEVTPDDWRDIVGKAVSQAKKGDAVARKWISDYLIGTPVNRTEISGKDGGPLETTSLVEIRPIDYRAAIAAIAPRPMGDSAAPGESEGS